jgi:hypothetical protein
MKAFLKKIYAIIPLKKEIFSVLKIFRLPENIYKHLHFKGVFNVKINSSTSFKIYSPGTVEENQLFWKGLEEGWEKNQ